MPDFSLGKIYKLVSDESEEIYIGSTTQSLAKRKAGHMANYKAWENGSRNYLSSFEILKYSTCQIILLESHPCNSREELVARERYYIELMDCVNKNIPGRSRREHYEDNRDHFEEYQKQYYKTNKERIRKYQRQYREDNIEKVNEKDRKFRAGVKKYCRFCESSHTPQNYATHLKTAKHIQNFIEY